MTDPTRPTMPLLIVPTAAALAFLLSTVFDPSQNLASFFLYRQDRWLLLAGASIIAIVWLSRRNSHRQLPSDPHILAKAGLVIFFVCLAGHYWVLSGYDISRDEQMADFDAAVFMGGRLVEKIPKIWRDHADALNTVFMYPALHRQAWISAYLPVNAAFRGLCGLIVSPELAGPLMTAAGCVALWGCARRIWPEDREAAVVTLLLYAGSGQVIFAGMTAYAMPAHLTLNLIWLWLFLRDRVGSDLVALVVGFCATGLHQPLMHPIFVAPLLLLLIRNRQWSRALIYGFGYAGICIFWMWWPGWTWSLVQAGSGDLRPAGIDFGTRLIKTVRDPDPLAWPNMVANLFRFFAWQSVLLAPLMIVGWRVVRNDRFGVALFTSTLVMVVVMAFILPYQGHGFGYRYLHGFIGSCILIAVYGWRALGQSQAEWLGMVRSAAIASAIVVAPLQIWMAYSFYAPAAKADKYIGEVNADYAVIGERDAPFSRDLVHNSPFLDRRPVRVIAEQLTLPGIAQLCSTMPRIALIDDAVFDEMNAYYGMKPNTTAARRSAVLIPRLKAAGCRMITLTPSAALGGY